MSSYEDYYNAYILTTHPTKKKLIKSRKLHKFVVTFVNKNSERFRVNLRYKTIKNSERRKELSTSSIRYEAPVKSTLIQIGVELISSEINYSQWRGFNILS